MIKCDRVYFKEDKVISKFCNNITDKDLIDLNNYYKILLCDCYNYLPCNNNGFLGIKIDVKDFSTNYKFNYTNDFEVYCFCPIYENKKKILHKF